MRGSALITKSLIFENGQFSGHFASEKNERFWRKNVVFKQELCFFEKKCIFGKFDQNSFRKKFPKKQSFCVSGKNHFSPKKNIFVIKKQSAY